MLSWPENPAFYNQLSRGCDVKMEKYDRSPRDTGQTAVQVNDSFICCGGGAFFETGPPVSQTDLEFPIPASSAFQIATSVAVQAGLKFIIFLFHPPEFWDLAKSFKGRLYKSDTTQKKKKNSSKPLLSLPYARFSSRLVLGIESMA